MEESGYQDGVFQDILHSIRRQSLSREELAEIKDEMAWDKATARFMAEGREEGRAEGREEGRAEGREEGACAIVLRLLQRRFGEFCPADAERIQRLPTAQLEALTDQHAELASIDELRAWLAHH